MRLVVQKRPTMASAAHLLTLPVVSPSSAPSLPSALFKAPSSLQALTLRVRSFQFRTLKSHPHRRWRVPAISASLTPLDLTEDNIKQVLVDARSEFPQIFDTSVNITGQVDLAELDGPFVKLRLKGRFWHKRSTVLARLGNYLKIRIPDILEVDIEDEKQLDDSPENF